MPPNGEPAVVLIGVSKSFPGVRALTNVDFECRPGEVHALVGENGSGKSTLIKVASGVLIPEAGSVHIAGEHLTARRHQAGATTRPHDGIPGHLARGGAHRVARTCRCHSTRSASRDQQTPRSSWRATTFRSSRPTRSPPSARELVSYWKWRGPCVTSPRFCCWTSRLRRSTCGSLLISRTSSSRRAIKERRSST